MKNPYIITGAGTGIGQAVTLELNKYGHEVIAVGRRLEMLEETKNLSASPDKMTTLSADISTPKGRASLIAEIGTSPIAGLIHCAGIFPIEPLSDITEAGWQSVFATNVEARLFLTQALLKNLDLQGRVLFIGSMSATTARKGSMAYCASKAASYMVQECLKKEIGEAGPAIGSAVPGPVKTPILDQGIAADPDIFPDGASYENSPQIDPDRIGRFLRWLLLETNRETFSASQWDIRNEEHHANWLGKDNLYIDT